MNRYAESIIANQIYDREKLRVISLYYKGRDTMASTILISLIVLIIFLFLIAAIKTLVSPSTSNTEYKYQRNPKFLTSNEGIFYRELMKTEIANRFVIFVKVRLSDLIMPQKGSKNPQACRNKTDKKHVDFVLCNPTNLQPVLVIELDDKTHDRPDRQERDEFVDQALTMAGIPILHTRNADKIENQVAALLSPKATAKK